MRLKSYKIYDAVKTVAGKKYLLQLKQRLSRLDEEGYFDDFDKLDIALKQLTKNEIFTLDSIDDIDLTDYGRQVRMVSEDIRLAKLEKILKQPKYIVNGKLYQVKRTVYLPSPVMRAYTSMNNLYKSTCPDRSIMLDSGYRHPIVQKYLIVFFLVNSYAYSLEEVFKRVLPPKYSQHCSPTKTALDLCNIDTEPDPEDRYTTAFANTPEYKWLKKHGREFGFYESYPEDNDEGIVWEPWHWQYIPNVSA